MENEVERETLKDRDSEGEKRSEVEVLREYWRLEEKKCTALREVFEMSKAVTRPNTSIFYPSKKERSTSVMLSERD